MTRNLDFHSCCWNKFEETSTSISTLSKQLVGRDSYKRNSFVRFEIEFCEFLTGHEVYEIFQLASHQLFLTFSLFFWSFWWTTFKVVRKFPKNRTRNVKANMNTCHSLQSSREDSLKRVTALYSCQNWPEERKPAHFYYMPDTWINICCIYSTKYTVIFWNINAI